MHFFVNTSHCDPELPEYPVTSFAHWSAVPSASASSFASQSGTATEACSDTGGEQDVGWIGDGDWLGYTGVDFGSTGATQFRARVASGAAAGVSGLVQVSLDSPTATRRSDPQTSGSNGEAPAPQPDPAPGTLLLRTGHTGTTMVSSAFANNYAYNPYFDSVLVVA